MHEKLQDMVTRNPTIKEEKARPESLMERKQFTFEHPFTMIVVAPTGGGKTQWVKSLLERAGEKISPPPERILWLYSQMQPIYQELKKIMPHIEFYKGLPPNMEDDNFFDVNIPNLVIIDDLMQEATANVSVCNLFTRGSHHRNLSVICLMQNLYPKGKEYCTICGMLY